MLGPRFAGLLTCSFYSVFFFFCHLADAFIQSDLQMIYIYIFFIYLNNQVSLF